jgi:hypothetical protein
MESHQALVTGLTPMMMVVVAMMMPMVVAGCNGGLRRSGLRGGQADHNGRQGQEDALFHGYYDFRVRGSGE